MTTEEIRAELQDVRYYYSRKAMFDRAKACVAKNAAVALAEKYGNAVRDAPPEIVRHICDAVCGKQHAGVRRGEVGLQRRVYPELKQATSTSLWTIRCIPFRRKPT